jgi:HYR domain
MADSKSSSYRHYNTTMKFSPRIVDAPLLLLLLSASSWPSTAASITTQVLRRDDDKRGRVLLPGEAPVLTCRNPVILSLSGTMTTVQAALAGIIVSATDNTLVTSQDFTPKTIYTCASIGQNLQVTATIADAAANTATCTVAVSVRDTGLPVANCKSAFMVQLNAAGAATITPSDINNGSTDNCDTSLTLSVSPSTFSCADVSTSPRTVTLTATDDAGNTATCTTPVTVKDMTPPTLTTCPVTPVPVLLSNAMVPAATLTINPTVVVATDACGAVTYSPTTRSYGCTDVGTRPLVVNAADVNGNAATCSAQVRVSENTAPVARCVAGPIALTIKGTSPSITAAAVNNGSSDNCGIVELSLSKSTFTCADIGTNTVTLTVRDGSGNTATCTVEVDVADGENPDVDCVNVAIPVSATGSLTLQPIQILANGDPADDNCGEPPMVTVTPSMFTCANVGQALPTIVTATATDGAGNSMSCTSKVTVTDTTKPVITACLAQTVTLSGTAGSLNTALYTATDNCSPAAALVKSFSQKDFTCADVGTKAVTVSIADASSNVQTCSSGITVVDATKPVLTCPSTIFVTATGEEGSLAVPLTTVTATDNCGTVTKSTPAIVFDCDNLSLTRPATVTATDAAGNTATCTTAVSIIGSVRFVGKRTMLL